MRAYFSAAHSLLQATDVKKVYTARLGGHSVETLRNVLFLFYTNSFLVRRRQREFGLYNVQGMSKGNVACIISGIRTRNSGCECCFWGGRPAGRFVSFVDRNSKISFPSQFSLDGIPFLLYNLHKQVSDSLASVGMITSFTPFIPVFDRIRTDGGNNCVYDPPR